MEASAKRSSYVRIFVPLHVIHVVLSFGIIIALVQIQISNNSRFEKFEANCQCNLNRDDSSGNSEEIGQRKTPSSKPFMHVRRSTELDEDGEITEFLSKTSKGINSSSDEAGNMTILERNGTSKVTPMTHYTEENEAENYNVSGVQGRFKNDTSKGLEKDFINGDDDMTNTDLEGNITDAELAKKMTNVTEVHGYRKTVESSYQNKTENATLQTEGKHHILNKILSGLTRQSKSNNASNNSSSGQENQAISVDNATTAGGDRQQQKTNQSRELPQKHLNRNGMRYLKGEVDLMLCLDELKVILDDYMISDKHSSSQGSKGSCKILKGERGEKGCAGTSFAAPSFNTRPQSVVFNERETAVLTCSAVANPRAEITWYRGNTQISDNHQGSSHHYRVDNRDVTPKAPKRAKYCPSEIPHKVIQSTLMIRNSNGSDTGTYTCKGHNILGATRFEIHALIQVFVEFVTIPSNITVVQGDDVKFMCRASGVPQPRITWYRKDGGPMPLHHNITMGDLYIVDIKKEQEGSFVCKATNILGSQTTEATITVNVFPKITSFLDQPITVNESTSLILPCNATGYPTPDIHWTKRKDSLPDDRHTYNGQFLNVSNVVYEDRGMYICFANNTVGVVNKSVEVVVQVSPKIIQRPSKFETGYLSLSKRLNFEVFSFPEATISWTRPLWTLQDDDRFRVENRNLVISNVTSTDVGSYEVVASNLLGDVKASTFLVVREPVAPWVRLKPSAVKKAVEIGDRIVKECAAIGRPSPLILWKFNGRILLRTMHSTSLTLNISSFQSNQFGKYTCEASNEFGSASLDFQVTVTQVNVQSNCNFKRISDSSGYIRSPGFPGNYRNKLKCNWKLTSNSRVRLSFEAFNTESTHDKVSVYDGGSTSSRRLGVYTGSSIPRPIISSFSTLYVTFTSDGSSTYTGFSAKYQVIV